LKQLDRITKSMTETARELALALDDLHPVRALVAVKSQGMLYHAVRADLGEEIATETLDIAYRQALRALTSDPIR
jgi:hypothetical protein